MITTEYAGNYVYETEVKRGSRTPLNKYKRREQNSVLQFFNTAEGYVEPKGTGWEYVYQYKDHLGNVRLSYADADGNGLIAQTEIREENNYYPFGLKHKGYNNQIGGSKDHKYGFGNKEEQDELGLGWIDITARNYDPALGRWMNLDPLAELMRRHSPYNYAFDNPIYFIDPDGMAAVPQGARGAYGESLELCVSCEFSGTFYSEEGGNTNSSGGGNSPNDWVYNKETGTYIWKGNVTSSGDPDLNSEIEEYVGKTRNDVTNHFNKNNNFFLRLIRSPEIDWKSFFSYLSNEINVRIKSALDSYASGNGNFQNKIDMNIKELTGNSFGGTNPNQIPFRLNLNLDGNQINQSDFVFFILRPNPKDNVLSSISLTPQTWNGDIASLKYPYDIQFFSDTLGRSEPIININTNKRVFDIISNYLTKILKSKQ